MAGPLMVFIGLSSLFVGAALKAYLACRPTPCERPTSQNGLSFSHHPSGSHRRQSRDDTTCFRQAQDRPVRLLLACRPGP
ncbi:hypothetical protein DSI41_10715, partial [Mycobacterium tuberculosis]